MSYAVLVPSNLGWMLKVYLLAEVEFVSVERAFEYIKLEPERKGEQHEMEVVVKDSVIGLHTDERQAAAEVAMDTVFFRYSPSTDMVLRGISIEIPANKRTAVVGRTAAGKTSILQVLLGKVSLWCPSGGDFHV